jgi:molybdate transport system substrate-binding protein
MGRPLCLSTLTLASVLLAAASAGEIKVMTSGAFAAAHLGLSPRFEQTSGESIVTVTTSTGVGAESIPSRIRRGDAVDVVILPDAALDQLIKDGWSPPAAVWRWRVRPSGWRSARERRGPTSARWTL